MERQDETQDADRLTAEEITQLLGGTNFSLAASGMMTTRLGSVTVTGAERSPYAGIRWPKSLSIRITYGDSCPPTVRGNQVDVVLERTNTFGEDNPTQTQVYQSSPRGYTAYLTRRGVSFVE